MTSIAASKLAGPDKQYCTPFYSHVRACDCFFCVLWFLYLEKMMTLQTVMIQTEKDFGIHEILLPLKNKFGEMYNLTEHRTVDSVIVLRKGRIIFWHCIPKTYKRSGTKIYKLCNSLGYTYDVCVFKQTTSTCDSSSNSSTWNCAASNSKV